MAINYINFSSTRNYFKFIGTLCNYLVDQSFGIKFKWAVAFGSILASITLGLSVPLILKELVEIFTTEAPALNLISLLAILYGLGWALNQSMINLRGILMWPVGERAVKELCLDIFSHLINLPTDFHINRKTGVITSSIEKVQNNLIDVFWGLLFFILPTSVELLLATLILWKICGFFYSFILLTTFTIFVFVSYKGTEWSLKAQANSNKIHAEASSYILDTLMNSSTVKFFNNQYYEINKCRSLLTERENQASKATIHSEVVRVAQLFVIGVGLITITFFSGQDVYHNKIDVGDFILINAYALQFVTPLSFFGLIFRNAKQAFVNIESALSILEIKNTLRDPESPTKLLSGPREITFDGISFGYEEENLVLQDFSIKIPAKKKTALVAPSGSGKSTIANLIFRLYDPKEGKILIDGQDVSQIARNDIQKIISVMPQDIVLFNATLFENIRYGNPQATIEEVEAVCKTSQLSALVKKLPEGLHTIVGERGLKLSGGEKQRVGIARALLKNPEIFILDEATSSLDNKTEKQIQKDIEKATKGITTLIIAHRLQTITGCDKIIVLENGNVKEEGTHTELLKNNGLYKSMWEKQTSGTAFNTAKENDD